MKKIKIEIEQHDDYVEVHAEKGTLDEVINLLMNAMDDFIKEKVDGNERRAILAMSIGQLLAARFLENEDNKEKKDDQKRTPPGLC